MKRYALLMGLFAGLFHPQEAKAQSPVYFSVALMQESVSLPFMRLAQNNPGAEIGVGLKEIQKNKSVHFIEAKLGFYHHPYLANGYYLEGEYRMQRSIFENLQGELAGGLGYLHTFYPGEIYKHMAMGGYEESTQSGKPHAIAKLGFGLSYNLSRLEPFLSYDFMLEAPFANGIPLFPHSMLKVGIRYKI